MLTYLIDIIEVHLIPLGGIGVFLASLIEEVFSLIPSPVVQTGAGFFLLPETISVEFFSILLWQIMIPAALGVTLGSLVMYSIGYWSGRPVLERWGGRVGLPWDRVESTRLWLRGHRADMAILFALRTVPVVPAVALAAAAGLVRMKPYRYLLASFFGVMVRSGLLAFLGWWAGALYKEYLPIIEQVENFLLVLLLLGILFFILYRLLRARS